jgi:hypothetical protein
MRSSEVAFDAPVKRMRAKVAACVALFPDSLVIILVLCGFVRGQCRHDLSVIFY